MFVQMGVPIMGVVENMSVFVPPDQPEKSYALFGSGGGQQLARENNVELLAQIPMEMPLQEGGNEGRPIVINKPNSVSANTFMKLAKSLSENFELNHS